MNSRSTARRLGILLSPPAAILFGLFFVPLAIMATYAWREGTFGAASRQFTWSNFEQLAASPGFLKLLGSSAGLALQTSLLAIVLAYPVAYLLAFSAGRYRLGLLTLLILPAWTSYLLRILAWKLILGSNGVLNYALLELGWIQEGVPIFLYSRTAVLITLVYVWTPFAALPIFSALERIQQPLLDAASDLGAKPWESFLRITLPLSFPGVLAAFFFVFIPTIGEWVTPALVGGVDGIMYGNLIQDQFVRALNWPMGSLLSMVLLAVTLVAVLIFNRFVNITEVGAYG